MPAVATESPEEIFRGMMRAMIDPKRSSEERHSFAAIVQAVLDHKKRDRTLEYALEIVGDELEAYDVPGH